MQQPDDDGHEEVAIHDPRRSEELRAEMRAIGPTCGNDRRYTSGGFFMALFWPEDAAAESGADAALAFCRSPAAAAYAAAGGGSGSGGGGGQASSTDS